MLYRINWNNTPSFWLCFRQPTGFKEHRITTISKPLSKQDHVPIKVEHFYVDSDYVVLPDNTDQFSKHTTYLSNMKGGDNFNNIMSRDSGYYLAGIQVFTLVGVNPTPLTDKIFCIQQGGEDSFEAKDSSFKTLFRLPKQEALALGYPILIDVR